MLTSRSIEEESAQSKHDMPRRLVPPTFSVQYAFDASPSQLFAPFCDSENGNMPSK